LVRNSRTRRIFPVPELVDDCVANVDLDPACLAAPTTSLYGNDAVLALDHLLEIHPEVLEVLQPVVHVGEDAIGTAIRAGIGRVLDRRPHDFRIEPRESFLRPAGPPRGVRPSQSLEALRRHLVRGIFDH
jgi:hypothetical protein